MSESVSTFTALLAAVQFAAVRHSGQRRKDTVASPYINHPIAVAELLSRLGDVQDLAILQAALLHDTVEDTDTTPAEVEQQFGVEVRALVLEVTDDKSLPKLERKRLQIEHAPHLSAGARQIKLADKICNVREIDHAHPVGWPIERKRDYLDWAERVVAGLRGCNAALENEFAAVLKDRRQVLGSAP